LFPKMNKCDPPPTPLNIYFAQRNLLQQDYTTKTLTFSTLSCIVVSPYFMVKLVLVASRHFLLSLFYKQMWQHQHHHHNFLFLLFSSCALLLRIDESQSSKNQKHPLCLLSGCHPSNLIFLVHLHYIGCFFPLSPYTHIYFLVKSFYAQILSRPSQDPVQSASPAGFTPRHDTCCSCAWLRVKVGLALSESTSHARTLESA